MHTELLRVDAVHPEREVLARAAELLRRGDLVAFPTETVYGLGANALDAEAVKRIFAAKGRPAQNPIIVHVAEVAGAWALVKDWPETAERLAQHFWPGPLTLVLPRTEHVPDIVTAGGPTVAIRVPAHPVARELLRACGLPLAAPSANRSSRLSPTLAEHVRRDLDGRIAMILDGGPTPGGLESTVLDLTAQPPRILRPGLVGPADLEAVVGPIELSAWSSARPEPLRSPGMLLKHYAPRTRLECVEAGGVAKVKAHRRGGLSVGWITFAGWNLEEAGVVVKTLPPAPVGYSAGLYAALHELDGLDLDVIVVDLPPRTPDWLAVHDRLRRASAKE